MLLETARIGEVGEERLNVVGVGREVDVGEEAGVAAEEGDVVAAEGTND